MKTFWFSDREGNLFSKGFEKEGRLTYFDVAESYAEEHGLQIYHPNRYPTEELARARMEAYGSTKYHVYDCPNMQCRYCRRPCRRIDHNKVKMHKSPFASYHGGENHIPCRDFELAFPEYADFRDKWNGIEDIWPVFVDAWLGGKEPEYLLFHLGDDFNTDYRVPFDLFFNGGMIEDGILKATERWTTVRDKILLGVQLYKLKKEEIGGVVIETGEILPVETAV